MTTNMTIEMMWILLKSKILHDLDNMLTLIETQHNPLTNMGMYGVEAAKQGWKLDKIIANLKKVRSILEDEK